MADGEPIIRLRSYRPRSEQLKPLVHALSDTPHNRKTPQNNHNNNNNHKTSAATSLAATDANSAPRVAATDSSGAAVAARLALGDDLAQPLPDNLAPSSRNHDLKRDIEPQMETLRALTDEAIVHLIRDRLGADDSAGAVDLATAVSQHAALSS